MSKYFLVAQHDLTENAEKRLLKDKEYFSEVEIVEMNALARIEVIKGNTKLNSKLVKLTNDHSDLAIGFL